MRKWIYAVLLSLLAATASAQVGGSGPGMSPPPVTSLTNGTISGQTNATGAVFTGATPFCFEGATDNTIESCFAITNPTGTDKTFTFPNATGNVLVTSSNVIQQDSFFQVTGAQDGYTGFLHVSNGGGYFHYARDSNLSDVVEVGATSNAAIKVWDPVAGAGSRYSSLQMVGGTTNGGEASANLLVWDDTNTPAGMQFSVEETRIGFGTSANGYQAIYIKPTAGVYKEGVFEAATLTANRTWTLPNATGTVALVETLPGPSGTYSDAFVKNLGGDGYRFPLDVDDYALTNTINDYQSVGTYQYDVTVTIVDTTPSIVGGNVRVCGKTQVEYLKGANGLTSCEDIACTDADDVGGATSSTFWTEITHVESSCTVLGGAGDETISVKWTQFGTGEFIVASTNLLAPATAFNTSVDFGLTNLALVKCDDVDGCTLTKPADASPDTDIGRSLTLINEGSVDVLVKDSDGDIELAGDADLTLGQFDTLSLMWIGDRWVQKSAANN